MEIMDIGTVTGREVKINRGDGKQVLVLQVQFSDPEDIQSVELMQSAGEDCNPVIGSKVSVLSAGKAWKIAVAVDDGIVPTMNPGEKKIYSVDAGTVKAFINMLVSGVVEINGNTDFAVRYTELETAFNHLKSDFNAFVGVYNSHTQAISGSTATAPTSQANETTADISPAKIETIKFPGVE